MTMVTTMTMDIAVAHCHQRERDEWRRPRRMRRSERRDRPEMIGDIREERESERGGERANQKSGGERDREREREIAVLLSTIPSLSPPNTLSFLLNSVNYSSKRPLKVCGTHVCNTRVEDKTAGLRLSEGASDDELWATACLRVRSFFRFKDDSFSIQDHKKYLAEREFEALKERIAGKRTGFGRVSCINATIPLSHLVNSSVDLCSACKFSENGEDRVVVGTLDINQCIRLPDEITGKRPQGIGGDFARAYLSNVCVAKELQRNGLGYMLISKSREVAEEWGISDLYVHVAIDNEPAKMLYMKSGFVYENDEPAWQARFMDRPRRILLWTEIPNDLDL